MVASHDSISLVLRRRLPAPPERVFQMWTNPDLLRRWFGPSASYTNPVLEVDFQIGGRYRIAFLSETGKLDVVAGEYLAIDPPRKLVFTWQWEPPSGHFDVETVVTVDFHPADDGTELVLTHDRFKNDGMRGSHEFGWTGALDRLSRSV